MGRVLMMADVVLEQIAKTYANGTRAVRDLNLNVSDGELVALVGPSGSGKTTILRLIAGLEQPTSGTIRIGGRSVNDLPARERDVALVFQRHSLYPHLSVRDNLTFGLRLRQHGSWPRRIFWRCFQADRFEKDRQEQQSILRRVEEVGRLLDIADLMFRMPAELSGGQQQRVALGRALVRRPRVLLLDEPLASLDLPLRTDLRRQLHLLHRRLHATMVYVTHDQSEAMTLGERIVVLDGGTVQQEGRPEVVYRRPRNRFVAGFVGWPPMSFVEGRLRNRDGRVRFEAAECSLPMPAISGEAAAERDVVLGIRPEDIYRIRRGGDESSGMGEYEAHLVLEVELVEIIGNNCLVSLRRDGWRLAAWMDARERPESGTMIEVGFDMWQTRLFDRDSGLVVGAADG